MTNKDIINKHLSAFCESQKMTVPVELESYLHAMLNEARRDSSLAVRDELNNQ